MANNLEHASRRRVPVHPGPRAALWPLLVLLVLAAVVPLANAGAQATEPANEPADGSTNEPSAEPANEHADESTNEPSTGPANEPTDDPDAEADNNKHSPGAQPVPKGLVPNLEPLVDSVRGGADHLLAESWAQKRAAESAAWQFANHFLSTPLAPGLPAPQPPLPAAPPLPPDSEPAPRGVPHLVKQPLPRPADAKQPNSDASHGPEWYMGPEPIDPHRSPIQIAPALGRVANEQPCAPRADDCGTLKSTDLRERPETQSAADVIPAPPGDDRAYVLAATGGLGLLAFLLWLWRGTVAAWVTRAWFAVGLRVRRKGADQHPVRVAILGHLDTHPGATVRELATAAGVGYNRVVYHLITLERMERVRIRRRGAQKHYFLAGGPKVDDQELVTRALVTAQSPTGRILQHLADCPGASLSTIATAFGFSPGHAHYHIARLSESGLIARKRSGRSIRHYLSATGRAWHARAFPHWRAGAIATTAAPPHPPARNPTDAGVTA